MNRFKYQAFLEEFPSLKEILVDRNGDEFEAGNIDSIAVKRIGKELLNWTPEYYTWAGSLVDTLRADYVHFILVDGDIIQDAVKQDSESGSNYAYEGTRRQDGETVLEAIDRHGISLKLSLIVIVDRDYDSTSGRDLVDERSVIVYKVAKDFTLVRAINEARQVAGREVRAETNF